MSLRPDASGSDPLGSRALFIGRRFCQLHLRGMLRLRLWRCQGLQSVLAPAARHREQRLHGVEAETACVLTKKGVENGQFLTQDADGTLKFTDEYDTQQDRQIWNLTEGRNQTDGPRGVEYRDFQETLHAGNLRHPLAYFLAVFLRCRY